MDHYELLLIAVGLSMDACAVAICSGISMPRITLKSAVTVGLYFGFFQAGMPLLGYTLGTRFADKIVAFDHWIAFALLCFIGGKMIYESFQYADSSMKQSTLKPSEMLPVAVATSIDALAVGISFAFLNVHIFPAAASIGIVTFILSVAGVKIGNMFGMRFKSRAEFAGGVILALMGTKILLDHTVFL